MKTRREMLKNIIDNKGCEITACTDCPYSSTNKCYNTSLKNNLSRIGAMAILRMFKEKKKSLLSVGTKTEFPSGRIATIVHVDEPKFTTYYQLDFGDYYLSIDYLIEATWEIVE